MADQQAPPAGPDLTQGVALSDFSGATLLGHVGDEDVLLVRSGSEIFAIDAHCSHYHGPLAEGLVVGESIRCPWHHACFDLRTGEAVRAPALQPARGLEGRARRRPHFRPAKARAAEAARARAAVDAPGQIVIVGGGAAGFAAAEMLRRQDFRGSIVMLSGEAAPPVDRPNLSKDYLAGSAPEDWLPLRPDDFYAEAEHRSAAQHRGRLDRHQGAQRRRSPSGEDRSLRPPAAGDRRGAGAAADSGRRPAACPYAALAGRLPRDH